MSLAGRILYQLYHRPLGRVRDSLRAGGPFEQKRTERGREAMESAAAKLPALPSGPGKPLELHLLTGRRFWYQTAFCLWTFARHAGRPLRPVIYDDGSLDGSYREHLSRSFPDTRYVEIASTRERLDEHLPVARFPVLRERWVSYPNIRKLIDVHLGSQGWKLVIDSDLLFFRRPDFLIDWLDRPSMPLHAVDCETSYGYSRALMSQLADSPIQELINVGLTGLDGAELDWEKLEWWCRELIRAEQTNYYLEQALIAMLLANRPCAVAPRHDYVTLPDQTEALQRRAVMHHYVAGSKRWYFQQNWRAVRNS